ncbi:MAG: saccharopine dehydrogenase family protein [Terrimicrobiaceae bacterium]
MRILVIGGGKQGRAAVYDLIHSDAVTSVTCADKDVHSLQSFLSTLGANNAQAVSVDASDGRQLRQLFGQGFDVVIDLLPIQFIRPVCEAAIDTKTNLVNTYYDHGLRPMADGIRQVGIAVLPEMGLDPGIDLVFCAEAVRRFDEVTLLQCYGAGFPEPSAADNPLKYKITWIWPGVLDSYDRPARLLRSGREVNISGSEMFAPENIHLTQVPGIGTLEAFPNGDAVRYARELGIDATVQDCGRYAMRWPGHAAIWDTFKKLGFLDQAPVQGLPGQVTPRQFMAHHLEPRLQYKPNERDVAVILVVCEGQKQGRRQRLVLSLVDYRDLSTGLLAMNRTVGFTASIAAQMLASKGIQARGLLSPLRDVPYEEFVAQLCQRGMSVQESLTPLG